MSKWSYEWASMKAENMMIWEGCSKIKQELEEFKDQYEDVADVATMEDELDIDQVGPGSCNLQTWMDGDTHMDEPHDDDVSIIDTCVSLEHLVDEPHAGKSKVSLPMQESILPWMSMMRHCMERQGLLIVAGLVGVVCDHVAEGTKACDKGGT